MTTTKTFELPFDHPINKLKTRRDELGEEMLNLDRAVREAAEILSPEAQAPTPPDERQMAMKIRTATAQDLVHGTNTADDLRIELEQARTAYQSALAEFERRREQAAALIRPKTASRGVGTKANELKAVLNREAADLDMLIRQAEGSIAATVMPQAEQRYLEAATAFMQAFYVLAGLKSALPDCGPIHAPDLPSLGVLGRESFQDYGPANAVAQAFRSGRKLSEDLPRLRSQLIPMAFHGVLPAGVSLTAKPNPRHQPGNPHSPALDYGVEIIPPEVTAA